MSMYTSDPTTTRPNDPTTPLIAFKRHLRVEVVDDGEVCLFSERGLTVLQGTAVSAIAPLLDGSRNLRTLLHDVPPHISPQQVAQVVTRLADAGVLTLRHPGVAPVADDATLAYWEAANLEAAAAVTLIAQATLQVIAVGDVDPSGLTGALRAAGMIVTEEVGGAHADLSVVLCDDYLHPVLAEIDAAHRREGQPWLLAKPVGTVLWLGPVFEPPAPRCWHCLANRLQAHRQAEACAQNALGRPALARHTHSSVPPLIAAALHLITLEVTKWLAGYRHPHQHSVWTFDSHDLAGQHHELRPSPQCAYCGNPELMREQARRPVVLYSRGKVANSAGGHRALQPEQVREKYRHLISPITGIIKEIRRAEGGPTFFNSFKSGPNVAARTGDLNTLRVALRLENGGKGATAVQAEVSAMCEAIERYSGSFQGDEERISGSLRSLSKCAIHPNDCQLFHERQYETRATWNASHSPFQHVCDPFEDDVVIDWTPVWSLSQQRHRLLPTGLLYFGAADQTARRYVRADSNGNAAGSSLEDAVLQGLLEIVERDAVALWWYNRSRVPAVDLGTFCDPWIEELRDVYAGLRRDVWVLDVTSDLGVPTMVAVSRRTDRLPENIMFGFGSHLDPRIALLRALTELNQLMPTLMRIEENGNHVWGDPDAARFWREATVCDQPYLLPDPMRPTRRATDYSYAPCGDIRTEVTMIQHRLESLGMEVLVLDQTRPDIGLPVAKVIVPGMRHFWARLAPGRLYDVPLRVGRQSEPTRYEDLNPFPMFL